MAIVISVVGKQAAVRFAAKELARHLSLATGTTLSIVHGGKTKSQDIAFRVGVCDDLGIARPANLGEDEDWIYVNCELGTCILSGSNPRSVLFAVYRYLQEIGFRWIRPGERGTVVPQLEFPLRAVAPISERPSYHYRTLCIEGSCSFEHVRDLIDWSAKHGMNGYFIQFEYGAFFLRRWYEHTGHPSWKGQPFSLERARQIAEKIVQEINKRGLRFERVGHGWTSVVVGLPAEGWDQYQEPISPEKQQWLAQMDGKRGLFHGVPLNTNLCYSNPQVRAAMTEAIAGYAAAHPEVSALHFWLADGTNNHCECENCQTARPADFYVDMLNELDEKLAAANLPTKIVFLIYVDLLWPPLRSRFKNPDRFVLMFAPITRLYSQSFADAAAADASGEAMTEYVRNQLQMPKSAAANLQYLREWQQIFPGDAFDFDYHLIWACYYDPNQYALARVLHQDIRALEKLGLRGFNSVQNQRISFPHNLLLDVLAQTLWNKKRSFDDIVRSSFGNAYGEDGLQVADFFKEMSRLWQPFFEPVFLPEPDAKRIARGQRNLKKMQSLIRDFEPTVQADHSHLPQAVQWSWTYLAKYLELLALLLPAFEAYLARSSECQARFERVYDFLWQNERGLHPALDSSSFVGVLGWRVHEATTATQTELAGGV